MSEVANVLARIKIIKQKVFFNFEEILQAFILQKILSVK